MKGLSTALPQPHRYRFECITETPTTLPGYSGSAWRGLLGHGLRKAACVTRQKSCDGCSLIETCVYNQIFESRAGKAGGQYGLRPHPFVLDVPINTSSGQQVGFELTLLGRAQQALPYIIHGFDHAGRLGIGRDHTPFRLVRVQRETVLGSNTWEPVWEPGKSRMGEHVERMPPVPPIPQSIMVMLETPLRIKQRDKLVGPREFETAHFLRHLWRRIRNISAFYGEDDFHILLPDQHPDGMATLQKEIRWHDWKRYSSRQKTAMNMGGLVGQWVIRDERLAQWWPLIWYGQWLHLGKATSMGLGRYRVKTA